MDTEPQGELFPHQAGELVKSPLCSYQRHCGAVAELGPEEQVTPDCINRSIRCLRLRRNGCPLRQSGSRHEEDQDNMTIAPTTHDRVCYTILIHGPMTQAALVQALHYALPVTVRRAVRELAARGELRTTPDGQYELTSREQIAMSREIVTSGASSENIAEIRQHRARRVGRLRGARPPSGNSSGRV